LISSVLTGAGYRVLAAASGEHAMGLIHGGPRIDLVLTDVIMPGMRGAELVSKLRTGPNWECSSCRAMITN
jgi:two-component system cell cycle sensor histidine kinase/response regulator CckA